MKIGLIPKQLGISMAVLLIAACGPLVEFSGGGKAPRLFQLNPAASLGSTVSRTDLTILVEQPTVPGGLRSDSIAVRTGEHEIKYLAGARWSDRASRLIERYFVESMERTGAIGVIGVESLDLPNDFRLKIDVHEFSAIAGPSKNALIQNVEIRISATVVRSTPVSIIATRAFSSSVNTTSEDPADVVAAMNEAADSVMADMFAWLLNVVDKAERARNE